MTVFGASGQLGRYIVNRFGMDGMRRGSVMCTDGNGHLQLVPAARL